jgi:Family of unknown function (DUF6011)
VTDDFPASDDLSQTLSAAPRQGLPQDEQLARIRTMDGQAPAAPAFKVTCQKCHGRGRFISYAGRDCGPCFTCKGKGHFERKNSATTLAANRAKAADRKAGREEQNWTDFVEAHAAEAAYILSVISSAGSGGERWRDMMADFRAKVGKYGDLTPGQLGVVQNAIVRQADRAAQKATVAQQAPSAAPVAVEYPNIREAFQQVVSRGAKRAQITIGTVNLSLAPMSGKNPGAIYVKDAGQYAGKLVGTRFFAGRDAKADLVTKLAEIESDPTGAIKAEADRAAKLIAEGAARGEQIEVPCGCCGILLTDPVSRARGIGPICAGKWGF